MTPIYQPSSISTANNFDARKRYGARMLLGYVDESYNNSFYYMAALLCSDEHAQDLASTLDAVVAKASRDYADISPDTELHGYELFHGKANWRSLVEMHRVRIAIYGQVFAAIGSLPVHIIIRGVDRQRLTARYPAAADPHSIVLSHLLERIDEHAASLGHRALVIADEVGQHVQSQCRDELRFYRQSGTYGYRGHRLTQIIDTLHFAPSKASRLVQAVDMVAFLARRILCKEDSDPRAIAANERLWAFIEPRVVHSWCWRPLDAQRPRTRRGQRRYGGFPSTHSLHDAGPDREFGPGLTGPRACGR